MAFELPPLPYSHSALAANGMCQETMELHHDKHHQAYVTALNGFVEKDPALQGKTLEEIVLATTTAGGPVFNNAGQHWNHILFWQAMSPTEGGKIPPKLEAKITEDLGGVDKFKDAFKTAATTQFGSGWAWLVLGTDGKLKVTKSPERLQPARHERGQGAAGDRCVGAQLLPGLPQPPPGLRDQLAGQAGELRIRRKPDVVASTQTRPSPSALEMAGTMRRTQEMTS